MAGPSSSRRAGWEACWQGQPSLSVLLQRLRQHFYRQGEVKMSDPKQSARLSTYDGPMYWLGQQIVKRMSKAGYPSKIYECYRSPDRQARLKAKGRSKAGPFQSPHQFCEAVDIAHKTLAWNAPSEYWEMLAAVVRLVAKQYKVDLVHGHYWRFVDSAHIELKDWRLIQAAQGSSQEGFHKPTSAELHQRFKDVLPRVPVKPSSAG